jgi:hypothetical protein
VWSFLPDSTRVNVGCDVVEPNRYSLGDESDYLKLLLVDT